jgi:uncharacterized membrane protein
MFKAIRNAFISGLIVLAPVVITVYVIRTLVGSIGAPTAQLFFFFIPDEIFDKTVLSALLNILATLVVLILITLIGWFSKYFFGRFIVQITEKMITSLPFVKTVYNTVKQIIDTFARQKKAVFQKVVLIEFPRKGIYAMGFLTGRGKGEVRIKTANDIINVFLPTTPNPTSGYLVMVPEDDVQEMEMTVAEGMKLIVSGGAVVPHYNSERETNEYVEVTIPEAINTNNISNAEATQKEVVD